MCPKVIATFFSICIVVLHACAPQSPKYECQNCAAFQTNVKKRNSSHLSVEGIMVSYGVNPYGCRFATLLCSNPRAKDILIEWYGPSGENLGITGAIKNTKKVISLINCNRNSQWTLTENGETEIIQSATCEYIV